MKELLDNMALRARRRRSLIYWTLFLLWETLGIRAAFGAGITAAGLLDDLVVVAVGLGLFAAMDALPRVPRTLLAGVLGLTLGAFVLANTLYFSFFKSFINADTILLMDQLPDTATSVWELLTVRLVFAAIVVPIVLLATALTLTAGHGPRRSGVVALACALLALPSFALGGRIRSEAFSVAEHNALLNVARQGVHRLADDWVDDESARLRQLTEAVPRLYNVPEDMRHGVLPGYPLYKEPLGEQAPAGVVAQRDRTERSAVQGERSDAADGAGRLQAGEQAPAGVVAEKWEMSGSDPQRPRNVVIVLMESMRGWETGVGTDLPSVTPRLKALSEQGLTFRYAYANGHQTVRGEAATLCSVHPNSGGGPIYVRYPQLSARCLPEILAEAGYSTHWIGSYYATYGNKRAFLQGHGVQEVHDRTELEKRALKRPLIGWGPSDEDLADFAVDVLDRAKPPFFAEIMTLSNHHPFNHGYPVARPEAVDTSYGPTLYRDYLHGLTYTDHAVGRFIDQARTRPWFEDTVFVFVGDHGQWHVPERGPRAPFPVQEVEIYFRTPLVFYAPAHLAPEVRDTVASQVDIAPTVLDLLDLESRHAFMGVSLLDETVPDARRFALLGYENGWSIRQGDRYCYAVRQTCFEDAPPYCSRGRGPHASPHACFTVDGDLLTMSRDEGERFDLLEGPARNALVDRGLGLFEANQFLLRNDALYPREVDGAADVAAAQPRAEAAQAATGPMR